MIGAPASTGISEPATSASVSATTRAASPLEAFRDHAQASPTGFERAVLWTLKP